MASPFQTVILRMKDLGMFQFLFPFMLTSAVFFGLLRRSKLFGDPDRNVAVNAVVALVAAFMVWASPVILGIDMETQMAAFFTQSMSATLIIIVGLLISSMFFKEGLAEQLSTKLNTSKSMGIVLAFGILIGGGILLSSGLINVFIPGGVSGQIQIPEDTLLIIGMMLLLVITVAVIVGVGGGRSDNK